MWSRTSRLPEVLPAVTVADVLELLRGAALGPAYEIGDRDVRRYLDEQMHVILRQCAVDDRYAHLGANLANDLAHPQALIADQHVVSILRRPDEMVAMMECRVQPDRYAMACRGGATRAELYTTVPTTVRP